MPRPSPPSPTQRICGWILSLCGWPVGILARALGGIPVNRRECTDHWKSGFYRLALATNTPVELAFIDHPSRRIGIDTYIALSAMEEDDLARLRSYYADKRGVRPEQQGEIRFVSSGARAGHGG